MGHIGLAFVDSSIGSCQAQALNMHYLKISTVHTKLKPAQRNYKDDSLLATIKQKVRRQSKERIFQKENA